MIQIFNYQKYLTALAFLTLPLLHASCHAQAPAVDRIEKNRSEDAESALGDTTKNGGAEKSKVPSQQVNEKQKLDVKPGEIVFPSYDFELGKIKLSYGLYLPQIF